MRLHRDGLWEAVYVNGAGGSRHRAHPRTGTHARGPRVRVHPGQPQALAAAGGCFPEYTTYAFEQSYKHKERCVAKTTMIHTHRILNSKLLP